MKNLVLVHALVAIAGAAEIHNPFTNTAVAKIVDGKLDVMRPGNTMPRPQGLACTDKSLSEVFAKWYLDTCYIAPLTPEEVATKLGIEYKAHPKHPGNPKTQPFALCTAEYGDDTLIILYIGNSVGRVGLLREKSVFWAYSDALLAARANVCPKNTKATAMEDLFRILLRSFTGSFATRTATPKAAEPAKVKQSGSMPVKSTKPTVPATPAVPTPARKLPPSAKKAPVAAK